MLGSQPAPGVVLEAGALQISGSFRGSGRERGQGGVWSLGALETEV